MSRFIAFLAAFLIAMSANAGNFFPPDFKQFPFREGDLLVSQRGSGKFAVNKVLKVDCVDLRKNASINIQGKQFVLPEDDYLLVVSAAYGVDEFDSFEQARAAALSGTWTLHIAHVPNRPAGAAAGQVLAGHAAVKDAELDGYRLWREAFDKGEAGVY